MLNKRIKYFSYRGCESPAKLRKNSPAADSKIDYIIEVLNRCGYSVDHISRASSSVANYIPAYVEQKGLNTFRYFASLGKSNSLLRVFNRWFMDLQFFIWCLINIKKNETIMVYHSLGYSSTFIKLKKIKNIHIIGEIEEIYQDVHTQTRSRCKSEYEFIKTCDSYLFPTSLLNNVLNKEYKPFIIIHGLYSVENDIQEKFSDGKIHVVYGGTLDPKKGGAAAAAKVAAFLPSNYHVHICGFGDSTEIKAIIDETSKKSKAVVTFEGELKGSQYNNFIQKCHIGLSTQNPDAAFNASSFPSKILVYLSNGLKVVSINIPAVAQSAVSSKMFFYNSQTPEEIAKAIENAVDSDMDGRKILQSLDKEFEEQLKLMLK